MATVVGIIYVTGGVRRIPIQHAKRQVGGRMQAPQSTFLPFKVNSAGVMPIIFAISLLMFPATIASYGGRYLVRGGALEVLEGEWDPERLVVLEFESIGRLREWYDSPEYALAAQASAATARLPRGARTIRRLQRWR